jgi:hypothetical protein
MSPQCAKLYSFDKTFSYIVAPVVQVLQCADFGGFWWILADFFFLKCGIFLLKFKFKKII